VGTTPPNTRLGLLPVARVLRHGAALVAGIRGLNPEREAELFLAWRARHLALLGLEPATKVSPAPRSDRRGGMGAQSALPRHRPLVGRITLLWPAEERFGPTEASRRWRRVGVQADVRVVPGTHLTAVTSHAAELAEHLRRALASAEDQAGEAPSATS
jgi:hypothetical protein